MVKGIPCRIAISAMTYDDAMAYWFGRINYETKSAAPGDLKLERMRGLLRMLGDPHERLRIVHIAGTKGKGSTAAMLAAILRASGHRVGLFTSPHLSHVEERVRVDGEPISRSEFASLMARIAEASAALESPGWPGPTFFEISTALGFLHFVQRRCGFAVIEVGLGGRFDSTNVCRPLVSVVTGIGLDHTAQLGDTLEAIAFQKAGIIKLGVPVVSGVMQDGPKDVVAAVAKEVGAPLWQIDRDVCFEHRTSTHGDGRVWVRCPGFECANLPLKLLGEHQGRNAALAVAAAVLLKQRGVPIAEAAFVRGLGAVDWPARIEVIRTDPAIILDTAHNEPSIEALIATLRVAFPHAVTKRVVFAVSNDKPYAAMLHRLADYFDVLHLTRYASNPRSVPPEALAALLPPEKSVVHDGASEAWDAAHGETNRGDLLAITGSVFLAGELQHRVRCTAQRR